MYKMCMFCFTIFDLVAFYHFQLVGTLIIAYLDNGYCTVKTSEKTNYFFNQTISKITTKVKISFLMRRKVSKLFPDSMTLILSFLFIY